MKHLPFVSLLILALVVLIPAIAGCEPIRKHTTKAKVLSIDKQVVTHGSEKSISTDIFWLVVTDGVSYHVSTSGFFSCPEAVGLLKVDSTYYLTIDGFFECRFMGMFPNITKVEKAQ